MAEKFIKIPINRFESNRSLLLEAYVFLPRNNRYVRLRLAGQYFEPQILENYKNKGHTELFVPREGLTETDPNKVVLHDLSQPYVGENNQDEFKEGAILTKELPAENDNVLAFKKREREKASNPEEQTEGAANNILELPSTRTKVQRAESEATEASIESKEESTPSTEAKAESDGTSTLESKDKGILEGFTIPKRKKTEEAILTPEEKEKEERRKDIKKRFFEDKLKNIRERQIQEAELRKKKEAVIAAKKKREEEIRKMQAGAENILDESRISGGEEDDQEQTVAGGKASDDPTQKFTSKAEAEEARRVSGKADIDNTKTKISGKADNTKLEEIRIEAAKVKQHRNMLATTTKLDETMEKLKETYLQRHKDGALDSFEFARLDPNLEKEIESTIISNELGKKLVVLGMQLEAVREHERTSNAMTPEEIQENTEMRARVLNKVDQIEKNLVRNRNGEKIDPDLRSELNIDLLKEEILEVVRKGDEPLEKVFNLTKQVEEIKAGLAKTENLIESKQITRTIAVASPGKAKTLENVLYADATAASAADPDNHFRNALSDDDPLKKDYYERLNDDEEMRSSADVVARFFKTSFVNEISNYTAQLGIAQGFHESGFLKELVMAALISLGEKSQSALIPDLPRFTQELLKKAETFESLDSTYVDALQIIALVKEIISIEGFEAGTPKVDPRILEPALQNALGKEEVFSLMFLERTKQFVERGFKVHDSGFSFQLSREAIVDLRKMCS
jgi:hypothetical protein